MTVISNETQNMEFNGYNFKAEWNISNFQAKQSEYNSPLFIGDDFEIKLTLYNNISSSDDRLSISFEIISIPTDIYLTYSLMISNKDSKKSIRINDNEIITAGKEEKQVPIQLRSHDITSKSGYLQNGSLKIYIFFKQETFTSEPTQQIQNLVNNSTDWFINTIISDFHSTPDPLEFTINQKLLKFALVFETNENETYTLSVFLIEPEITFNGELEVKLNNHKYGSKTITKSENVKFSHDQTDISPFTFDLKAGDFLNPNNGWIIYDNRTKDIKTGLHFTITFIQLENIEEDIEKDAIVEKLPTIKIKNVKYLKSERPLRINVDSYGLFNINMRYSRDIDFEYPIHSKSYHTGEIVIQFDLDVSQEKLFLTIIDSLSNENDIDIILVFFNTDPCLSDLHRFVLHYSPSNKDFSFNLPFSIDDLNDDQKGWMINDNLNIRIQIDGSHFDRQWIENYTYPIFNKDKKFGFYGWEFYVPVSLFDKSNNCVMLNPIVIDVLNINLSLRYDIDQSTGKLILKPKLNINTQDESVLHAFIAIENKDEQKRLSYKFIDVPTTVKNLQQFYPQKSLEEEGFIFRSDFYKKNLKISIRLFYTGIIDNSLTRSGKMAAYQLNKSNYLAMLDDDSNDESTTDIEENKRDDENEYDADKEVGTGTLLYKNNDKGKEEELDKNVDSDKNTYSDKEDDSDKKVETNKDADANKKVETDNNSDEDKNSDSDKKVETNKNTDTDADVDKKDQEEEDNKEEEEKKKITKKPKRKSKKKRIVKRKNKRILKKKATVKDEKSDDSDSEKSEDKTGTEIKNESNKSNGVGYVGLKNQCSTCYLNSLLQSLFHLPAFRKIVYEIPTKGNEDETASIPLNLQRLFYKMQFSKEPCSTVDLTRSFVWDDSEATIQQDVEEFLRLLIDNLEEKMKGTDLEKSIPKLLRGRFRTSVTCTDVDYQSVIEEYFYDLSMKVKGIKNLFESFLFYVKPDELTGANQYDTSSELYGKQDAFRQTKFIEFPPVLHIKLDRIIYDHKSNKMVKINDRFEFPLMIDLKEFLTEDSPDRSRSNIYDLYGVLVHAGNSSESGHYYAYLRTSTSPQWYLFNDTFVNPVNQEKAVNNNYGNPLFDVNNDDGNINKLRYNNDESAYILVYIRREEAESIFAPIKDDSIPYHLKNSKDLIKVHFAFDSILRKNSINRINGFFPPKLISQYNNRLYPEMSFIELIDINMVTFDLFEKISEKVHLDPTQINLWYCNSNNLPEDILINSVEVCVGDYFKDQNEVKIIIQQINEIGIENPNNLTVFIKFFFSEELLRRQQFDSNNDILIKQLQVPLQYLDSVTVKMNDNIECLVPFINNKIGLNNDAKLEAFLFEPNGNVEKLSLDKSFLSNNVSNGSLLAFQVNSETVEKIPKNSLKFKFIFELEDKKELFEYKDDSKNIHESLKTIENYVKSDFGRCNNKLIGMKEQIEEEKKRKNKAMKIIN